MLNSPKTNILADRLIMRPLSLLDEIASKSMHKEDDVQQSKKKKTPNGSKASQELSELSLIQVPESFQIHGR